MVVWLQSREEEKSSQPVMKHYLYGTYKYILLKLIIGKKTQLNRSIFKRCRGYELLVVQELQDETFFALYK